MKRLAVVDFKFFRILQEKFIELSARERFIVVAGSALLGIFFLFISVQSLLGHLSAKRQELTLKQAELAEAGPLLEKLRILEGRIQSIEDSELTSPAPPEGLRPYIERLTQQASIKNPVISTPRSSGETERTFHARYPIIDLRVTFSAPDLGPLLDLLQSIETSEQPLYVMNLNIQRVGSSLSCELDILGIQNQKS